MYFWNKAAAWDVLAGMGKKPKKPNVEEKQCATCFRC